MIMSEFDSKPSVRHAYLAEAMLADGKKRTALRQYARSIEAMADQVAALGFDRNELDRIAYIVGEGFASKVSDE